MPLIEFAVFHPWKTAVILVLGTLMGLGAFYAYQLNTALAVVAVEEFDTGQARMAMAAGPASGVEVLSAEVGEDTRPRLDKEMDRIADQVASQGKGGFNGASFGEPVLDEVFDAYLLVGTDASGFLADTIILALAPADASNPIMVSLPRDLFVWNVCEGTFTRLNAGLGGCGDVATGPELLAVMVEDYTGIPIDHLARVDFDGFARLIDVMGGISVCVDYPTRDVKAHLDLKTAGCQVVDGKTALAWVRSRRPEQLIGGQWKAVTGSDFTRQGHQQDVLFQLADKAAKFTSPATLSERLAAVTSVVRLDSSWSMGQAVATAWKYRGISRESVNRFKIEVEEYTTSYGAAVLLPKVPFQSQLTEFYDSG